MTLGLDLPGDLEEVNSQSEAALNGMLTGFLSEIVEYCLVEGSP